MVLGVVFDCLEICLHNGHINMRTFHRLNPYNLKIGINILFRNKMKNEIILKRSYEAENISNMLIIFLHPIRLICDPTYDLAR